MRVLFSYQENMIQAFRRLMLGDNELVSQEMYFHYGKRKGKKGERVATYTDFKLTVANIQITYPDEEAAQEKQKQKQKGSDDDDSDEEKKRKKPQGTHSLTHSPTHSPTHLLTHSQYLRKE
jgi:ribosomal protein L24